MLRVGLEATERRCDAIDMLGQIVGDALAHRIEDELDAFPSRQFCCGHEVAVSGNEDYRVGLRMRIYNTSKKQRCPKSSAHAQDRRAGVLTWGG